MYSTRDPAAKSAELIAGIKKKLSPLSIRSDAKNRERIIKNKANNA